MNLNLKSNVVVFAIALVISLFFVAELVEARGRGGGGRGGGGRGGGGRSFSRSGIASGGGFSSRSRQRMSQPRTSKPRSDHRMNKQGSGGGARDSRIKDQRMSNSDNVNRDQRQQQRQQNREDRPDNQEDRQEARKERQEDRQDFIDDQHDDYWDDHYGYGYGYGYGPSYSSVSVVVVGGAETEATYVTTLPCSASAVVVNSVTYYNCSSNWYQRSYSGSEITYMVVQAPQGY